MNNYKVKKLGGMFWASDLLLGQKPIPQKQNQKQKTNFDNLLKEEINKLKDK